MRVTAVQDSLVLPYIDPHSQKYKSITKYQGFRHLTFVLYRRGRHESTNQLRSIKGFGTCHLYFLESINSKVQINYEVSRVPAFDICTFLNLSTRKYKSTKKFQWVQRLLFVLQQSRVRCSGRIQVQSPRQLRVCRNGSNTVRITVSFTRQIQRRIL